MTHLYKFIGGGGGVSKFAHWKHFLLLKKT